MPDTHTTSSVFAKRLKQARLRSGLTQEELGVLAGIDEFSASARINQYERGKHLPHALTGQHLARALHVPTSFLYEEDDLLAALLTVSARLTREKTKTLLAKAEILAQSSPPSRKPK